MPQTQEQIDQAVSLFNTLPPDRQTALLRKLPPERQVQFLRSMDQNKKLALLQSLQATSIPKPLGTGATDVKLGDTTVKAHGDIPPGTITPPAPKAAPAPVPAKQGPAGGATSSWDDTSLDKVKKWATEPMFGPESIARLPQKLARAGAERLGGAKEKAITKGEPTKSYFAAGGEGLLKDYSSLMDFMMSPLGAGLTAAQFTGAKPLMLAADVGGAAMGAGMLPGGASPTEVINASAYALGGPPEKLSSEASPEKIQQTLQASAMLTGGAAGAGKIAKEPLGRTAKSMGEKTYNRMLGTKPEAAALRPGRSVVEDVDLALSANKIIPNIDKAIKPIADAIDTKMKTSAPIQNWNQTVDGVVDPLIEKAKLRGGKPAMKMVRDLEEFKASAKSRLSTNPLTGKLQDVPLDQGKGIDARTAWQKRADLRSQKYELQGQQHLQEARDALHPAILRLMDSQIPGLLDLSTREASLISAKDSAKLRAADAAVGAKRTWSSLWRGGFAGLGAYGAIQLMNSMIGGRGMGPAFVGAGAFATLWETFPSQAIRGKIWNWFGDQLIDQATGVKPPVPTTRPRPPAAGGPRPGPQAPTGAPPAGPAAGPGVGTPPAPAPAAATPGTAAGGTAGVAAPPPAAQAVPAPAPTAAPAPLALPSSTSVSEPPLEEATRRAGGGESHADKIRVAQDTLNSLKLQHQREQAEGSGNQYNTVSKISAAEVELANLKSGTVPVTKVPAGASGVPPESQKYFNMIGDVMQRMDEAKTGLQKEALKKTFDNIKQILNPATSAKTKAELMKKVDAAMSKAEARATAASQAPTEPSAVANVSVSETGKRSFEPLAPSVDINAALDRVKELETSITKQPGGKRLLSTFNDKIGKHLTAIDKANELLQIQEFLTKNPEALKSVE